MFVSLFDCLFVFFVLVALPLANKFLLLLLDSYAFYPQRNEVYVSKVVCCVRSVFFETVIFLSAATFSVGSEFEIKLSKGKSPTDNANVQMLICGRVFNWSLI